ncbi:hypothetical protein Anas_08855 [Armadillidium nasatum]|uniref:Alpha-2-macroglobulin bait region domain-containing protein n=1 Tax=Armadillidium nasatum TaxID=96803 RepID=A0A5N5TAX6_9CRUS|nr:hypothetical protein Anas_08855 [Armadillidium nasatum]
MLSRRPYSRNLNAKEESCKLNDPVDVETKFESLTLQAELKDASGSRSYASLVAVAHHSEKHKHLQISTSTKHPKASLKTFPLALTAEMAGTSTVIVYALERGEPLVTDALTFHVDALTSESLKIKVKGSKVRGNPSDFCFRKTRKQSQSHRKLVSTLSDAKGK